MITTRRGLKVVAPVAAGLLLAACSGSSQPASAPTTQPPHSVPPSFTVAAARQRATQFLALYSAGQWAAVYEYIAPGLDKNISKQIWLGVHETCKNPTVGPIHLVSHGLEPVGVYFSVSPAAAASALGTKLVYMGYYGGQWYWDPTNGWIYFGHSLSHAIAKAKGQGLCLS